MSKVEFIEIGDADFPMLAAKGQVDFAWVFEGWEVIDGELRGLDLILFRDRHVVAPGSTRSA